MGVNGMSTQEVHSGNADIFKCDCKVQYKTLPVGARLDAENG